MPEIRSHTVIRGIAALLVVIYHFRTILQPAIDIDAATSFFAQGYLWVDCFFMLSGFILCYVYGTKPGESKQGRNRFLVARFARVYPLHFASLASLAFASIILPRISNLRFYPNWTTFLLNLINIHAWGFLSAYDWNFPSWSISVEFAAHLAFPMICIGILRSPKITFTLMIIAFCGALALGRDHWERLALWHGLPMFFAGILIFHIPPIKWLMAPLQVISLALLLLDLHFAYNDTFAAVAFAGLIYSTQMDSGLAKFWTVKPLHTLGDWSYSMYMLHIPVRLVFFLMFPRATPIIAFCGLIAATMCAAATSYSLFELRVRRWIVSWRT